MTTDNNLNEQGIASLLGTAAMSLILLGLIATMVMLQVASKAIAGQLRYQGQVVNVATAGSVEGLSWFQKQATQPVTTFSPQRNMSATPPINETEVSSIGIVRTYPLSAQGSLWGRYEVRASRVLDVTTQRGKSGAGGIWQFDSTGLVFVDANGNSTLDWTDSNSNGVFDWGEPGEVVAVKTVRSEAQRLSLVLPAGNAAIQSRQCNTVSLTTNANRNRVLGSTGGVGIACKSATGALGITGATVSGNPATQTNVNPYNDSINNIFGVNLTDLISLATIKVPDAASLPSPMPPMSLMVVQGNATFTPSIPMNGSGILVVLGNLTIQADTRSTFNGIVFVTGNYSQGTASLIRGAVIGQGSVTLTGGSDITEVDWDPTMVQMVRNALGKYRFTRTQYIVP